MKILPRPILQNAHLASSAGPGLELLKRPENVPCIVDMSGVMAGSLGSTLVYLTQAGINTTEHEHAQSKLFPSSKSLLDHLHTFES